MVSLFDIQPATCRQRLPTKEINQVYGDKLHKRIIRVLELDPAPFFERIQYVAKPFERVQISRHTFGMHTLFPEMDKGICVCGCGNKITGKRRKWASDECNDYGWFVYCILTGRHEQIYKAIWTYYGSEIGIPCLGCGELNTGIEIDHTHPVHKGGGCCWLSNLKPLCIPCHKEKTKSDLRPVRQQNELSLF